MTFNGPIDTFATRIGNDRNRAAKMIAAINNHAWAAWQPGIGFPYQPGSGYGDMNDKIIPAPPGQYQTNISLNRAGTTAQVAQKISTQGALYSALKKWWTGKV